LRRNKRLHVLRVTTTKAESKKSSCAHRRIIFVRPGCARPATRTALTALATSLTARPPVASQPKNWTRGDHLTGGDAGLLELFVETCRLVPLAITSFAVRLTTNIDAGLSSCLRRSNGWARPFSEVVAARTLAP
jgi:hypothetical protein